MGQGGDQTRTNLSMTIFLSDPASYDGASSFWKCHSASRRLRSTLARRCGYNNLLHYAIEL
jgi:hypothetical protein